ncbi:GIY-YIG nuclease family protein [Chelatococcus sp. CO-6]|nr:GIY-YIG nuclease family protein [Chelatococcus sp. CO-6]
MMHSCADGRTEATKLNVFIKFYGLFWRKDAVDWDRRQLLGQPQGWLGKGNKRSNIDLERIQMNFYRQKGVYILYSDALQPVYAGQAGLTRKNSTGGQSIGDRLYAHSRGVYRNGWSLFSWFGFLETERLPLTCMSDEQRQKPVWTMPTGLPSAPDATLNTLLASFEAILIEGFTPRFNARRGDLPDAVIVDQYEPDAAPAESPPREREARMALLE